MARARPHPIPASGWADVRAPDRGLLQVALLKRF